MSGHVSKFLPMDSARKRNVQFPHHLPLKKDCFLSPSPLYFFLQLEMAATILRPPFWGWKSILINLVPWLSSRCMAYLPTLGCSLKEDWMCYLTGTLHFRASLLVSQLSQYANYSRSPIDTSFLIIVKVWLRSIRKIHCSLLFVANSFVRPHIYILLWFTIIVLFS